MRLRFTLVAAVLGLALLAASPLRAAEMPPVDDLQARMGAPAATVTVYYEPHLSVGDTHVAVDYVGYPAVDVMAHLFGQDWQGQAETIEFRALDGYVSRIAVERFLDGGRLHRLHARRRVALHGRQPLAERNRRAARALLPGLGQHREPRTAGGGRAQLALSGSRR